jgi:primosomal protein N' (replication factor Y) (superfamily II helicase)
MRFEMIGRIMNNQKHIADVLVPVAVDTAYSYGIGDCDTLREGDLVIVPLGKRETLGVVWSLREGNISNLKHIKARIEGYHLTKSLRDFIDWVARWTLSSRGMVLRMALPRIEDKPKRKRIDIIYNDIKPKRMSVSRARILDFMRATKSASKSTVMEMTHCSAAVIDGLITEGVLSARESDLSLNFSNPIADFNPPRLEPHQQISADHICARLDDHKFSATLLEGVTGSGKTEVYFEAIAHALRHNQQILILVPEIALTSQFLDRFTSRFGVAPATWHSSMNAGTKALIWEAIAAHKISVVVGARSALFLPFADLGLIITDEEHETAYKQEDGVIYHARDMAIVRAHIEQAAIILASATPSIETRVNAQNGKFFYETLAQRFGGRTLPQLTAIDLNQTPPTKGQWISPPLINAIHETLARQEQALLFLNRRGYAPLTLCRSCGYRFQCPTCSAWLVDHRQRGRLICHHCGYHEQRPHICPACHTQDQLASCGPGVERLAEEVTHIFPDARHLILSSDNAAHEDKLKHELALIEQGDVDIIIGTQLVAKGHNFPKLTLVGVVDADVGLANGDPRATERTFQLLQQVTGRAGRGIGAGFGILQSWQPHHPVMQALLSGDKEKFYAEEIKAREIAGLPPFTRLGALIISHKERSAAEYHARALARAALNLSNYPHVKRAGESLGNDDFVIFGPAEAPIAQLRGKYRFRLLIKAPRHLDLQSFIKAIIAQAPKPPSQLRVTIDIDPQNFL